uniref:Capsid protein VP1 n=1 Tax=kestrel polyomavirus 1 TaxID=3074466 RepID=A0AA51Z0M8_9POLY|nr:putative VP1 [kestrel polyomavirus 1]
MAPQKRRGGDQQPSRVPKLLIKGGIEVLELRTGPDSTTTVECYLNPRMGSKEDQAYSTVVTVSYTADHDQPNLTELPCYSCSRIPLPMLNEDMTSNTILMWEAVAVKTEVVGVTSMINCHSALKRMYEGYGIGIPIEGLNLHFFAVGGEPLELQAVVQNWQSHYPEGVIVPPKLTVAAHGLDPTLKGRLDKDGKYPVEVWSPDPSRNENTRYFGAYTGGQTTPPVLQLSNTVTTVLLDEHGVGPLCKGDGLYVSACDIVGFVTDQQSHMFYRGLPRYFNVQLRKRLVRNPYPVSTLLNTLFNNFMPRMEGQPMVGDNSQVEEVRVYEGTEPLPGDPDMVRYIDRYGEQETAMPAN